MSFSFFTLLYKEIVQFFRNRGLLLFAVYAFTLDIYLASTGIDLTLKNAPFYAEDYDLSYSSRELLSRFPPPYFRFKGYLLSDRDVERVLLKDEAVGVIRIPFNFEKSLKRGDKTEIALIVNGAEVSSSYLFSAYATQIIYNFVTGNFFRPPIEVVPRVYFNQNCSSKLFMAYSELMTVITLFLLLLPAAAVVLEKERGNIEMLTVSPLPNIVFMVAKSVAMGLIVLSFSAFALFFTVERVVSVPFRGSELDFLLLTLLYVFTASGLSMFIASLSENMLQVSQLTILLLIPILYLSGNWTPIEAMPKLLQWLSVLSPLKYYIDGALAIAIKGVPLKELTSDIAALTLQGGALFALGNYFMVRRI